MNIAIIPARGGSRRIPRKNVKKFNGKPIIYWSIKCALQTKLFDQVIVSTDDKEIARLIGYVDKEKFYESIGTFIEKNTGKFNSKPEGSHGPMDDFGSARVPPEGVINSRDLLQHMYKTPKEALKASEWFGCHGNVHYHEAENVWMPCTME